MSTAVGRFARDIHGPTPRSLAIDEMIGGSVNLANHDSRFGEKARKIPFISGEETSAGSEMCAYRQTGYANLRQSYQKYGYCPKGNLKQFAFTHGNKIYTGFGYSSGRQYFYRPCSF